MPSRSKRALREAATAHAACSSERAPQNSQPSIISALASAVEGGSNSTGPSANGKSAALNGTDSVPNGTAAGSSSNGTSTPGANNAPNHSQASSAAGSSTGAKGDVAHANGLAVTTPVNGVQNGKAKDKSPRSLAKISLSSIRASKVLYPLPPSFIRGIIRFQIKHQLEEGRGANWIWHNGATHEGNQEPDDEELKAICQRFGYVWRSSQQAHGKAIEDEKAKEQDFAHEAVESPPSRLYLMMLADALLPLPRNHLSGVVSPSLIATTGIVPLSIFSTGPDIIGHYYDCIISAKKEVIIMTNYWQGGRNVDTIAESLRELNRREGLRKEKGTSRASPDAGGKIVVKIMWDRGPRTLADLFRLRKPVPPGQWKANGLPEVHEVPHLTIEILNYHRPLMGTFHAKLLLIDRKVALINSNNIQDRPNVEACCRLEGDIVNSIYDHALISWGEALKPPLPCLSTPAPAQPKETAFATHTSADSAIAAEVKAAGIDVVGHDSKKEAEGLDSTEPEPVPPSDKGEAQTQAKILTDSPLVAEPEESITDGLGGLPKAQLLQRAKDARERLRMDDEEAEEEKERVSSPRRSVGEMMDNVWMMRRRYSHEHGRSERSPERSRSMPVTAQKGVKSTRPGDDGTTDAAATESPASPVSAPEVPVIKEPVPETSDEQRQSARLAGAAWARKVLGEKFKGIEFKGLEGLQPRSPFGSFTFGSSSSPSSSGTSGEAAGGSAAAGDEQVPMTPTTRRHFADVVEALMSKEGIRPPGWAEGALEVFGLGESSSRNVALEVRKARKEAAQAKMKSLNIPMSVAEEGGPMQTVASPTKESAQAGDVRREASASKASLKAFPARYNNSATSLHDPVRPSPRRTASATPSAHSMRSGDYAFDIDDADDSDQEGHADAPGSSGYRRVHLRTQSNASRQSAAERLGRITASLDFANNSKVKGEITAEALEAIKQAAKDGLENYDVTEFEPYVFHKPHKPVPMAMVNRRPHGTPGHSDIRNPQDAAWLAGFRYAKEHVFIQSPTLNASPVRAAVLATVRRHVRVELWLDLGFNDKSESMPFQGGTNEQVVTSLYRQLRREGKGNEKYLEVYWYTGKDMTRPLNAVRKQRNCHVKFAAFDGQVGIIGSGNQDTQSWWHSQECNVMVDSEQIVAEWMRALRKNQSTHIYGKVDQRDGIWRGQTGREVADTGKEK